LKASIARAGIRHPLAARHCRRVLLSAIGAATRVPFLAANSCLNSEEPFRPPGLSRRRALPAAMLKIGTQISDGLLNQGHRPVEQQVGRAERARIPGGPIAANST